MHLSAAMASPSVAKLVEGWCEMAAAKPKVKRMMFGGAAKGVAASMQGAAKKAVASKTAPKQMQFMSDQLRGAPMTPQEMQFISDKLRGAPMQAGPIRQDMSTFNKNATALRKLPMNPPMPGKAGPRPMQSAGRTVLGSPTVRAGMAGKSLMKKGGAVKKATKK